MGLALYFTPESYYSQKAVLALAAKGLSYEEHQMTLTALDHLQPWYMKINPKGKVPVLKDGDDYIADSTNIIRHLDEKYGGPALIPDSGSEAGRDVQHCVQLLDSINVPVLTYGTAVHHAHLDTKGCQLPEERLQRMKGLVEGTEVRAIVKKLKEANPDMVDVYTAKYTELQSLAVACGDLDAVKKEVTKTRDVLQQCSRKLQSRPGRTWLCGDHYTLADIVLSILLTRTQLLGYSRDMWEGGVLEVYRAKLAENTK